MTADPRIDALLPLLAQYRSEVARAFESVPAGLRDAAPSNGAWSVAKVVEHLAITEGSITRLLSGFVAEAVTRDEEPFDAAVFAADLDMPFFLDRTRPIKGSQPPGALTAGAAWKALAESRVELLKVLEQARGRRLEAGVRNHPIGKPLNGYQWISFIALHEGRHAAQIVATAPLLTT